MKCIDVLFNPTKGVASSENKKDFMTYLYAAMNHITESNDEKLKTQS